MKINNISGFYFYKSIVAPELINELQKLADKTQYTEKLYRVVKAQRWGSVSLVNNIGEWMTPPDVITCAHWLAVSTGIPGANHVNTYTLLHYDQIKNFPEYTSQSGSGDIIIFLISGNITHTIKKFKVHHRVAFEPGDVIFINSAAQKNYTHEIQVLGAEPRICIIMENNSA